MTDTTELAASPGGVTFGREIADYAMAELRHIALTMGEAAAREKHVDGIGSRAMRAICTAAQHRHAAGLSKAEADAWASDARRGFDAAMAAGRLLIQHESTRGH